MTIRASVRTAAILLVTAGATTLGSHQAYGQQPQPLTKDECKAIAGVYIEAVKKVQTSDEFRNSMIAWVNPSSFTCDGPKEITIKTNEDSDAFVTIRGMLGSATRPIDIMERGGLRAAGPAAPQQLTESQCNAFKIHFTGYIKDVGRQNLSDAFVNAMIDFSVNRKCTPPANIPVNERELDIFNAISGIIYRTQGVELKKIGVVPVARATP